MSLVIIVIFLFTLAALFDLWRVGWFYRQEQKKLTQLVQELKENKRSYLNDLRKQESSGLVSERVQLMDELSKNKKLKYLQGITQLATNKKFKPIIINEIVSFTQRRDLFAQFSIAILFVIGITSLILPIVIDYELIANLIKIIPESDAQLVGELKSLSKLNFAYVGAIVCAVCLFFVRLVFVQPVKEYFIAHLDWITIFYLVPIFGQYEQRYEQRQENKQYQLFTKNLEESLKNNIDELQQQLIKHNEELTKQHNNREEIDKSIKEFVIIFQQAQEAVDQLKNQLEESANRLENFNELDKINDLVSGMDKQEQAVDQLKNQLEKSANRLENFNELDKINDLVSRMDKQEQNARFHFQFIIVFLLIFIIVILYLT